MLKKTNINRVDKTVRLKYMWITRIPLKIHQDKDRLQVKEKHMPC